MKCGLTITACTPLDEATVLPLVAAMQVSQDVLLREPSEESCKLASTLKLVSKVHTHSDLDSDSA